MVSNGPSQFDVIWRKTAAPESLDIGYEGALTETKILEAGWRLTPEHAPFRVDTVWEKDVQIPLRDGVKIRADIFRPKHAQAVPALIAWSPYGKSACRQGGFNPLEMVPGRVGVPKDRLSGFEKFEAPDPAEWAERGYAIVNPDCRGTYESEGDLYHFGEAEAKDGYDVIEYIAQLDWCNKHTALIGNSWLGIAQWFIAAERPPHLSCIAPLEGASDFYREILCRGGIPQTPFWGFLSSLIRGRNKQEDVVAMLERHPLMNEYWSDKRARVDKIDVPAYVLASYSTFLHTFGSFRGYIEIPHEKKWLRVHPTQEWHDLYKESTNEELQKFFDCYTKGVNNNWESTPRVRVSILTYNKDPIVNKEFKDWPVPNTANQTFYLINDQKLYQTPTNTSDVFQYKSDAPALQIDGDSEELGFTFTFQERTMLVGCARAVLYMSCEDHDDFDVFVQIRKADSNGKTLRQMNIPPEDRKRCAMPEPVELLNPLVYLGPPGCLRASHRQLDHHLARDWWPEHDYSTKHPVKPGEVVKLEIGMWQAGIAFEPGEKLVFKVAGHNMTLAEFPDLRGAMPNYNKGIHKLHVGGEYPSHLVIPTVAE